jgi:hypothetical protein
MGSFTQNMTFESLGKDRGISARTYEWIGNAMNHPKNEKIRADRSYNKEDQWDFTVCYLNNQWPFLIGQKVFSKP